MDPYDQLESLQYQAHSAKPQTTDRQRGIYPISLKARARSYELERLVIVPPLFKFSTPSSNTLFDPSQPLPRLLLLVLRRLLLPSPTLTPEPPSRHALGDREGLWLLRLSPDQRNRVPEPEPEKDPDPDPPRDMKHLTLGEQLLLLIPAEVLRDTETDVGRSGDVDLFRRRPRNPADSPEGREGCWRL
ncbi:hypothetical protein MKZ38_003260 [Zalerion maritima]|uniref:Uncharacterized protein n=1 Tax=Zalerion maritima TaxID=339359 RepID=A0AAD5S0P5_9PEZI|nr:hypothetical protein MKZ38_003260 [Zalerion maritima]